MALGKLSSVCMCIPLLGIKRLHLLASYPYIIKSLIAQMLQTYWGKKQQEENTWRRMI
jgi:hypothetical protein